MHGLTAQERREAKSQQAQANEQITLLEKGNTSGGSDFYSYRYLATEGFLPGYNFPRLPLYAYVPASGFQGSKAAFLQRARFLAIAEFGPLSLIYHEGRAYRVFRARLPAGLRTPDGKLATANLYVCDASGAAHDKEPERCHVCGESSWVEQEAEIRGLSGWVRNRRDGSVEAVFSGETTVVDAMTEACRSGPRMAVVENVKVVNTSTDRDLRGFRTIATV
jgi:acylphosphatase